MVNKFYKRLTFVLMLSMSMGTLAQPYTCLPLREIRAEGWMKNQMVRDISSGYISVYDKLQPTMQKDAFGPKKINKWEYDHDEHGNWTGSPTLWAAGEHEGYFADSVVRSSCLTDYGPWKDKARQIIDRALKYQDDEGYIGIYDKAYRLDDLVNQNADLWTQSRMINAILEYYWVTGNEKYLMAAVNAVDCTISHFKESGKTYFQQPVPKGGGLSHGLLFIETLEWLYNITGDKKYVDFGFWLYEDFSAAEPQRIRYSDCQLGHLLDRERMFQEHAPHVAEQMRAVFWLSTQTDDPAYKQAVDNIFYKLKKSLSPTGSLVSDPKYVESVAGNYGSPDLPYEYCTSTELLISYCSAFQKFGDPSIGDEAELLAFNAAQGARFADGKAVIYLSRDNQKKAVIADGFRYQYGACHRIACCNLNASKFMPYYVSNMWMKDERNNAMVAFLYGASDVSTEIQGAKVNIFERTLYPFENRIEFTIDPEKPKKFSLVFRDPSWSTETFVNVAGGKIVRENGMIRVTKKWQKGDRVELIFQDKMEVLRTLSNELYVKKGPILYAMKIDEQRKATEVFDQGEDLANYDLIPADMDQLKKVDSYQMVSSTDKNVNRTVGNLEFHLNPDANQAYPFDQPYSFITCEFLLNRKLVTDDLVPLGSTLLRKMSFDEGIWKARRMQEEEEKVPESQL